MYKVRRLNTGKYYTITPEGYIMSDHWRQPSKQWVILGVAHHHWCNSPTWRWPELRAMLDAGQEVKGWVFDVDHGTVRSWGNRAVLFKTRGD